MKALHTRIRNSGCSVTLAVMLAFLLCIPTLSWADTFEQLKGFWQCQEEGQQVSLEFVSRQQLLYNGRAFPCQLGPEVIQVQSEYGLETYLFTLEDNFLIILSSEGVVIQCQKAQKPQQTIPRKDSGGNIASQSPPQPGNQIWPPPYARPQGRIDEYHPDAQALLYKFAGRWDHYSNNRLTNLYLKPDGTYEEAYEAGFSGVFKDQSGYQTGNWGATGTQQARGTWKAVGSLRQGKLYLQDQNGRQDVITYEVHIKGGEVFWGEYFFNGRLYSVEYIYR